MKKNYLKIVISVMMFVCIISTFWCVEKGFKYIDLISSLSINIFSSVLIYILIDKKLDQEKRKENSKKIFFCLKTFLLLTDEIQDFFINLYRDNKNKNDQEKTESDYILLGIKDINIDNLRKEIIIDPTYITNIIDRSTKKKFTASELVKKYTLDIIRVSHDFMKNYSYLTNANLDIYFTKLTSLIEMYSMCETSEQWVLYIELFYREIGIIQEILKELESLDVDLSCLKVDKEMYLSDKKYYRGHSRGNFN